MMSLKKIAPVIAVCALALGLTQKGAAAEADWIEVFNGKDLHGWVVEGTSIRKENEQTLPVWTVVDGEIRCGGGGFGFLRLDREVCDFEFKAEFQPVARANSGLGIRTVPYRNVRQTRPSFAAYEIQLQDDFGKPADTHSSGSLYRYVAPTENAIKPPGEWNTVEVRCVGPRIVVILNGRTVQDVDQTKYPEIKNKPLCGYVSLQNHGSPCAFRKVQLRVLKGAE